MEPAQETTLRAQPGPQQQFIASRADIAIYGGAAGGGKSWSLVFEAARNASVPGYSAIIFRRTSTEIKGGGSIWDESAKIYPLLGGEPREHRMNWRFPSGATIEFSHLQYLKDVYSHQGKQYAFVGFDELTHFEEGQFWYLVSRMRTTCRVRPYMRAATNPDPDSWVRKFIDWWIEEDTGFAIPERAGALRWFIRDGDEIIWGDAREDLESDFHGREPLSVTFVPAKLEDNPMLTRKDPSYRSRLLALPRVEREQLLGGNWNIRPAAGMYFKREFFEFVDNPPPDGMVTAKVRAWDKAATKPSPTNPDPDWTVGVRYSKCKDGYLYIEHAVLLRGSPMEVERAIKNTVSADGRATTVAFWQDPGQAGVVDIDVMKQMLSNDLVTVKTIRASKGKDKVAWAGPVSSMAESGRIRIVKGAWNDQVMSMLESFPSSSAHDDAVDALSLAHTVVAGDTLGKTRALMAWG